MSQNSLVRFTRSCPTCGRRIQIRGSLLGRVVACRHCQAEFVAMAADDSSGCMDESLRLMERVERALSDMKPATLTGPADPSGAGANPLSGVDG